MPHLGKKCEVTKLSSKVMPFFFNVAPGTVSFRTHQTATLYSSTRNMGALVSDACSTR